MNKNLFQSLHSPIGSSAAFALGLENAGGGFMFEDSYVTEQDIYIGYKEDQEITLFPFYKQDTKSGKESYTKEDDVAEDQDLSNREISVKNFPSSSIEREFSYGSDTFSAKDIEFKLTSRFSKIEDIENLDDSEIEAFDIKTKILPSIIGKLTIDNTKGNKDKEGIFTIGGIYRKSFLKYETDNRLAGLMSANGYGFAVKNDKHKITEVSDFDFKSLYSKTPPALLVLGPMSGILIHVPKGEKVEVEIAFGWFKEQYTTEGNHRYKYLYTDYFESLIDVFDYTFEKSSYLWNEALLADQLIEESDLSCEKQFLVNQAAKSYYVSSMLMTENGNIRWIMNEGTFLMMNTFDLIVDHMFFDLRYHGWVVRNQLEYFANEYSYYDQLGISFTHDQGVRNLFTPNGTSSYEIPNIRDCFSYMTHEELCNWILTTSVYVANQGDDSFAKSMESIIDDCLTSMIARDGQGDGLVKDGVMDIDSSRCGTGAEITTYDSLDESLGQARRNLYMAVKCFGSYIGLASLFEKLGDKYKQRAELAYEQAVLCATTINENLRVDGTFPAIIKEGNETLIIPVIEGILYPYYLKKESWMDEQGQVKALVTNLQGHMNNILEKGKCLFDDGGWKLSANTGNSWMSKIFLCQYITTDILQMDIDMDQADKAHTAWWMVNCRTNPGIDQIFDGQQDEVGFHYPRGVTNTLWW